ncbi:uncharacterized protein LOC131164290 [Malania oleifera]|uniref:uncharacterized protein LOC131164290 n=1 Tax=Malania oleifera TaxID=397392 RepID=UPI0025AE22CD|nr:uncharacterized protein LOC131164290 [Malania oleifera]
MTPFQSERKAPMGVRHIEINGMKLAILESDDVYDSVTGRPLTGSWLWDSALVLSRWMASHGQAEFSLQGKTVLELGAGLGLPGLTAALLGARRVLLTDVGSLLPGLERNVEANGLGDRVEVQELVWGSDESMGRLGEFGDFDVVLMSDVFFDAAEMAALAKTLRWACGRETRCWAASEVREWTWVCLNELVTEGFRLTELPSLSGQDVFAVYHIFPPSIS